MEQHGIPPPPPPSSALRGQPPWSPVVFLEKPLRASSALLQAPLLCLPDPAFHPPQCEVLLGRGGPKFRLHKVRGAPVSCPFFGLPQRCDAEGEGCLSRAWGAPSSHLGVSLCLRGLEGSIPCSSIHTEHSAGLTKGIRHHRYTSGHSPTLVAGHKGTWLEVPLSGLSLAGLQGQCQAASAGAALLLAWPPPACLPLPPLGGVGNAGEGSLPDTERVSAGSPSQPWAWHYTGSSLGPARPPPLRFSHQAWLRGAESPGWVLPFGEEPPGRLDSRPLSLCMMWGGDALFLWPLPSPPALLLTLSAVAPGAPGPSLAPAGGRTASRSPHVPPASSLAVFCV